MTHYSMPNEGRLKLVSPSYNNEFSLLQWPCQSPVLNSVKHFVDVVEWEIFSIKRDLKNAQELCDAIISTVTRFLNKYFQHVVKFMP